MESRPSFNEGGRGFQYNIVVLYEKLLQRILYMEYVKKVCSKCICYVNKYSIFCRNVVRYRIVHC